MKKLYLILFLALLIKLIYFGFALIVNSISDNKFKILPSYTGFTKILKKNDAGWYEKICKEGYPKLTNKNAIGFSYKKVFVQSSWAFFPFYPYLNRYVIKILDCDYSTSALILSLLFSMLSFVGFYQFNYILLKDERIAFFNTLLFMVLPFNYYFSVFYTEAIFFTFLIYSFLAIHYKKEWFVFFLVLPLALVIVLP